MSVSRVLAELAIKTSHEEVASSAIEKAKRMALDSIGCAIAGCKQPGVGPVLEQMSDWGGKAEASVLVYGGQLPAPNTAFVNSTMIHAFDFDDWHSAS